jgi:protoheme ferro-lyase
MLADAAADESDGVRGALAFVTSAYSSYKLSAVPGRYRAQEAVGEGAPIVEKIRVFNNHPGFVDALVDRLQDALAKVPQDRREAAHLVYTAHSIPVGMAQTSDYEKQLKETGRLVAEKLGRRDKRWRSLTEPERAAVTTLAGTRHPGLPPRTQGAARQFGCGDRADRFRLRPPGNSF